MRWCGQPVEWSAAHGYHITCGSDVLGRIVSWEGKRHVAVRSRSVPCVVVACACIALYAIGFMYVRYSHGGLYDEPSANVTEFRVRVKWSDWCLYYLYWPALKTDEAITGRNLIRNTYPDIE
jgi:hypothetical protein